MRPARVALVTGASGGIGRAIAMRLVDDGYVILAHYNRDANGAARLSTELKASGGVHHSIQANLSQPSGLASLTKEVRRFLDRHPASALKAIVNNAGVMVGPSWESITVEDYDRFLDVNTRAPFFLIRELAQSMPRGGSIVNISSASAHISSPANIAYAMSKAALESMTKNFAAALAIRGIRVNAVIPGYTNNGHAAFSDPSSLKYMASAAPLGDVGSPADVAHAVSFLVSDLAARTTGSLLDVSGGTTLSPRTSQIGSVSELAPRSDARATS
ncbi:hypothetical protein BOH66_16225 [Microbacterium aurum]|uniref:Short-chain dehydrogenase n=1 Tax=Microbacterium aurum TaxID=36805 RepID=A0A1P8UBU8_9MICO|nr:SDR family oxidoreductase [Microbacterium aurum]APZ35604.1 hypothetical protein BOH66_16225 [Microbacterium aurum]